MKNEDIKRMELSDDQLDEITGGIVSRITTEESEPVNLRNTAMNNPGNVDLRLYYFNPEMETTP